MTDDMTKAELQDEAREAGLPVSGTKDELIERLQGSDGQGGERWQSAQAEPAWQPEGDAVTAEERAQLEQAERERTAGTKPYVQVGGKGKSDAESA